MKMTSGYIATTALLAVCTTLPTAYAYDSFDLFEYDHEYPAIDHHEYEIDRPVWELPDNHDIDFTPTLTFDSANYKTCAIESFKFTHGLMGKHYNDDVRDFYLVYSNRAAGAPSVTFDDWTGYSHAVEMNCHTSGTTSSEWFDGPPGSGNLEYFKQTAFDNCEDLSGTTHGEASQHFIGYDPMVSDGGESLSEEYNVSFTQSDFNEALTSLVKTDTRAYVDAQGSDSYMPFIESVSRDYENSSYRYSVSGLQDVQIDVISGEYRRRKVTGSNGNDGDFIYIDGSHTLDGCYDHSGDVPVRMNTTVRVFYRDIIQQISGTSEVLLGQVAMDASDGSRVEIIATPGDTASATVLLIPPANGAITSTTVPWSELLP